MTDSAEKVGQKNKRSFYLIFMQVRSPDPGAGLTKAPVKGRFIPLSLVS